MIIYYMNRVLLFAFIFIFLVLPETTFAKVWGRGEVKLDKPTMEHLMMYMYGAGNTKYHGKRKNKPDLFVLSEDGKWSSYYYCPMEYQCDDSISIQATAIKKCEKRSIGKKCYVFALKRRIVWKNGGPKLRIKKKDLKSPYKVAKLIQDAGFYDGDITELAGIDATSGQIDNEIKITGQKKTNNTSEDNNTSNTDTDIVKQLENLKQLYQDGSLTKEEFDKAKKKLLSN